MTLYYRKSINRIVDDVKSRIQMGALTLKLCENINRINDLLEFDKNIKKDIVDNSNLINLNKENISKNDNEIYKKVLLITSNDSSLYGHKKRLDVIEDIKKIDLNTSEILDIKTNVTDLKNNIKNNSDNVTKNYNISQTNKKKSEVNASLIDNHTNTLKTIKNDIDKINSNIYVPTLNCFIENIYLFKFDFFKELDFKSDIKSLLVYETIIQDSFKKDSFLELNESILYKFNDIKAVYYILKESYEFLNENNNILDKFYFNIFSKDFIFYNIHIFKNTYYYEIPKDTNYLKIRLHLERINQTNSNDFGLKITNQYQTNYISLKYLKNNI